MYIIDITKVGKRILYLYNLKSHPDKFLINHLSGVSTTARLILNDLQHYYPFFRDKKIDETLQIICLTHDLGKATSYFQDYLQKKVPNNSFLKSHSTLSSLYSFRVSKNVLDDDFFAFITLMAVQGHHGRIPSPSNSITRIYNHLEELKDQFDHILFLDELNFLLSQSSYPNFKECLSVISPGLWRLDQIRRSLYQSFTNIHPLYPYFMVNMLFSILIDADRIDAADLEYKKLRIFNYTINSAFISEYISKIENAARKKYRNDADIIKLRSQVRETVLQKAEDTEHKLFSLTAPTGSGKTLTALLFATILRNKIFSKWERIPKIIYVLPFLSIIDQNTEVLRDAIGLPKAITQSKIMITHHHLAKLKFEDPTHESYSESKSQLIIEGWNAELIITTFVQFLQTVIGSGAVALRKLHNLVGSIIILDEVQAIDYKHWLLIHDCLLYLTKEFDVRIILMTATQPLIFKKDEEILELFDKEHSYPERVTLHPDLKGILLSELSVKINNIIKEYNDKNILIIMNTISSSVYIYNEISVEKDEKFYLSASIIPIERRKRIKEITQRLEEEKRTILISTQVVEAGVDFDFDIVIRDLAPLDSIIQAAGRCNRNGIRSANESKVFIFAAHDNQNKYYANKIYGEILIEKTRITISNKDVPLSDLINTYYEKVKESGSQKISTEIIDYIKKLDYENIEKNFKVIEDQPKVSVYIEIDENAASIWKEYKSIINDDSNNEQKRKIRQFFLKKRDIFYSYIVNTWPEIVDKLPIPFEEPFYYIERNSVDIYYKNDTGLDISN